MKRFMLLILLLCLTALAGCRDDSSIPPHTHEFGEWRVRTAASCNADGTEVRYCSCGAVQERTVGATGRHSYNSDNICELCGKRLDFTAGLGFILSDDGTGYILTEAPRLSHITVPYYHGGKPVIMIGSGALSGHTELVEIVLPDTLISIGEGAFSDCKSLATVEIPSGVTQIAKAAFSDCESLKTVIIPEGVSRISENTFKNCTSIEAVDLPSTVIEIADGAFSGCTALEYISGYLVTLSPSAFDGCVNLVSPPHVHTFSEWNAPVEPTCEQIGYLGHYYCDGCRGYYDMSISRIENVAVAALGHSHGEWFAAVESDCENDGVKGHYLCTVCGAFLDRDEARIDDLSVPATGHTLGEWVFDMPPDCVNTVQRRRDCEKCDYFEIEPIEPLDHSYGRWQAEIPSTCNDEGVKGHYKCEGCGYFFDQDKEVLVSLEIPKKLHTGGISTCSSRPICTACGQEYGDITPNAHTYITLEAKEPTFDSDGLSEGVGCKDCADVLVPQEPIGRYALIVLDYDGEKITVDAPEYASVGTKITVRVLEKDGWHFCGWYSGNTLVSELLEYTVEVTADGVELVALVSRADVWDGTVATAFSSGSGTEADPYIISSAEELALLAALVNGEDAASYNSKHYRLNCDADLSLCEWTPIGVYHTSDEGVDPERSFMGVFDGAGHTVFGLKITDTGAPYHRLFGLFGRIVGARIEDLNIDGASIDCSRSSEIQLRVGGLAALAESSVITRSSVNAEISVSAASHVFVGGIAALALDGSELSDCHSTGSFVGSSTGTDSYARVGGIVGALRQSSLASSYTGAGVRAESFGYALAGGLVGHAISGASVTRCLSDGTSAMADNHGGFCYYSSAVCGKVENDSTASQNETKRVDSEDFYTSELGWSTDAWDFTPVSDGLLPTLIQS